MTQKDQQLLTKIQTWQNKPDKRIVCPHNSLHILQPIIKRGKLYMVCPNEECNYKQSWVPEHFIK